MNLPIDIVPGSNPPRFKWRQMLDGHPIEHETTLPVTIEAALVELISLARRLAKDNEALREKVIEQAEMTGKTQTQVEAPRPPPAAVRKGK